MWNYGDDNRVLILDMDGTIADTYNYPDWAGILRGHVKDPWTECGEVDPKEVYRMFTEVNPMITAKELENFCNLWDETVVFSMVPWDATLEVVRATVKAKLFWLHEHYPFLKNIVITKHKDEKNYIDPLDVKYIHFETVPAMWQPGKDDTLVDDNETLLRNFIGKTMLPPWVNRLKL